MKPFLGNIEKMGTLINILLIGFVFLLCFSSETSLANNINLEVVKEEELKQLFTDEKYVICLFSDDVACTGKCKSLEKTLLSVREDLVEDTGGWVVRSYAPTLSQELGINGAGVIFMREGKPLLYEGSGKDEEAMLSFLLSNKISVVHNFTDENFEHETQAGTGATTGDWLVMFTRRECDDCKKYYPIVETVAVKLKGRKNVAIVEREIGAVTARRFGVKEFPYFILFRLGKLYRYIAPVKDVSTITAFALDTFRNSKGEDVPQPKSPFDDVTEAAADWLRENTLTFLMTIGSVVLIIAILVLLNRPPPKSWTKSSKKKKQ